MACLTIAELADSAVPEVGWTQSSWIQAGVRHEERTGRTGSLDGPLRSWSGRWATHPTSARVKVHVAPSLSTAVFVPAAARGVTAAVFAADGVVLARQTPNLGRIVITPGDVPVNFASTAPGDRADWTVRVTAARPATVGLVIDARNPATSACRHLDVPCSSGRVGGNLAKAMILRIDHGNTGRTLFAGMLAWAALFRICAISKATQKCRPSWHTGETHRIDFSTGLPSSASGNALEGSHTAIRLMWEAAAPLSLEVA